MLRLRYLRLAVSTIGTDAQTLLLTVKKLESMPMPYKINNIMRNFTYFSFFGLENFNWTYLFPAYINS